MDMTESDEAQVSDSGTRDEGTDLASVAAEPPQNTVTADPGNLPTHAGRRRRPAWIFGKRAFITLIISSGLFSVIAPNLWNSVFFPKLVRPLLVKAGLMPTGAEAAAKKIESLAAGVSIEDFRKKLGTGTFVQPLQQNRAGLTKEFLFLQKMYVVRVLTDAYDTSKVVSVYTLDSRVRAKAKPSFCGPDAGCNEVITNVTPWSAVADQAQFAWGTVGLNWWDVALGWGGYGAVGNQTFLYGINDQLMLSEAPQSGVLDAFNSDHTYDPPLQLNRRTFKRGDSDGGACVPTNSDPLINQGWPDSSWYWDTASFEQLQQLIAKEQSAITAFAFTAPGLCDGLELAGFGLPPRQLGGDQWENRPE
jgi:hypothetical protein